MKAVVKLEVESIKTVPGTKPSPMHDREISTLLRKEIKIAVCTREDTSCEI